MDQSKTDQSKGRAIGVGGVFFRSADPKRIGDWYREHLGLAIESWGDTQGTSFSPSDMPQNSFTVWSAFSEDTGYFGNTSQSFMTNLVVDDLDAALENVAAGGGEFQFRSRPCAAGKGDYGV